MVKLTKHKRRENSQILWKIVITWVNFKHCVDGRKRENRSHARHGLVCSGSNTYKRHTLFDYVQFPLEPGRRQYLPSKRKKSIFPEKVVKSQWFCIIFREVVVIWRIILIVKIVQFLSKKNSSIYDGLVLLYWKMLWFDELFWH